MAFQASLTASHSTMRDYTEAALHRVIPGARLAFKHIEGIESLCEIFLIVCIVYEGAAASQIHFYHIQLVFQTYKIKHFPNILRSNMTIFA